MGRRRRSAHRPKRTFLMVTPAETTADIQVLSDRVVRALREAEILGLADVRDRLDDALACIAAHAARPAEIAGQGGEARSLGQHEVEGTT